MRPTKGTKNIKHGKFNYCTTFFFNFSWNMIKPVLEKSYAKLLLHEKL